VSSRDDLRGAIRSRLEWLQLMGVSDLRPAPTPPAAAPEGGAVPSSNTTAAGPRAATTPSATAPATSRASEPPPAASTTQHGLFGEVVPAEDAPPRRARAAERSTSPLAGAQAPEAPDSTRALQLIRDDLGDCRRCRLAEKRTQIVFGVGDPKARLMFVGEGPGADEDAQGEPFVGRAGQLLTRIIESMGMKRGEVYIANIVKCRPPENRTPLPDEVATCSPFLLQQIAAIGPKVIVCLGTPAAQTLLGTRDTITRLRGSFKTVDCYQVMPTFHPAYLLRNPAAKREVWEDMKQVIALLKSG
jgi:uracil-DNA glycosylase family 4